MSEGDDERLDPVRRLRRREDSVEETMLDPGREPCVFGVRARRLHYVEPLDPDERPSLDLFPVDLVGSHLWATLSLEEGLEGAAWAW